jgi:hypothetical protein
MNGIIYLKVIVCVQQNLVLQEQLVLEIVQQESDQ